MALSLFIGIEMIFSVAPVSWLWSSWNLLTFILLAATWHLHFKCKSYFLITLFLTCKGLEPKMRGNNTIQFCILYDILFLLQAPVHTIASNAGVEGAVVVGKLLELDDPDLGYDAAKGLPSLSLSVRVCV